MALFTNRVYDDTAAAFVRWSTASPDSAGGSYPGPGTFGVDTADYCVEAVAPAAGGGVTEHSDLTDLLADDHTQYPLLAGRGGGQTIYGGTGAAETLSLRGTAFGAAGSSSVVILDNLNLSTFNITNVGSYAGQSGIIAGTWAVNEGLTAEVDTGGAAALLGRTKQGDVRAVLELDSTISLSGSNPGFTRIHVGNRDPNSNVDAPAGALYVRTDTATPGNSTLYVKTTAAATLTGWVNVLTSGSGAPAGSDTQIQFNNSGAFGASANLTWNGSTLAVGGSATSTVSFSVTKTSSGAAFAATTGSGETTRIVDLRTDNGAGANGSITGIHVGDQDPNISGVTSVAGALYIRADAVTPSNSTVYVCTDPVTPVWLDLTTDGFLPLTGGTLTGALATTPLDFSVTAGAVSLDTVVANDFQQTDTITEATVITLTNGFSGRQGAVLIKQDGTGYAVTFAAAGRTVLYVGGSVPTTADALISCGYLYTTVNGVDYLYIYPAEIPGGGGLTDGDKGDITVSGGGATWTIDADVVGPNELADTAVTAGSYTLTSLTVDQQGRITAASSGSGVALTDGDKGDITVSSSGTSWQIDADVVTNTELNDMPALSVKTRSVNSVGDPSDTTAGAGEYGAFRERGSNLSFRRESYQTLSISSGTATFTVATSPNATLTHDGSATLVINLVNPVNGEGGHLILVNGAAGQPYDEPEFQLNGATTNVVDLQGVDMTIYSPNNNDTTIFCWTFDGTRLVVWVEASNYSGS